MPFTPPFTPTKLTIFGPLPHVFKFEQIARPALCGRPAPLPPAPSRHSSPPSLPPPPQPLPSATGGGGVHVHACEHRIRVDQAGINRGSASSRRRTLLRARTRSHVTHPTSTRPGGTAAKAWPHAVASGRPQTAAEAASRTLPNRPKSVDAHVAPQGAAMAGCGRLRRVRARPSTYTGRPAGWHGRGRPSADAAAAARRVAARAAAAG